MALILDADRVPKVSVCVVNWNCCDHLCDLLTSLSRAEDQTLFEIIVVDNGSTDDAVSMVRSRFPAVKLIENKSNTGFAHANNQAIGLSRGEYLFLLNNDTVVPTGTLDVLSEVLDQQKNVVAVAPKLVGVDGTPQPSCRRHLSLMAMMHRMRWLKWTGLFKWAYESNRRRGRRQPDRSETVEAVAAAAMMVRREALESIGGFDTRFAFGLEDADLCLSLQPHGSILFYPSVSVTHLGGVASRANADYAYAEYAMGFASYFRKHGWGGWAARLYKLAFTVDQLVIVAWTSVMLPTALMRRNKLKFQSLYSLRSRVLRFWRKEMWRFWTRV